MRPFASHSLPLVFTLLAGCTVERASTGPAVVDIPLLMHPLAAPHAITREVPPGPLASRSAPFPAVVRSQLATGLRTSVAEMHSLPLVQVRVVVGAGIGYGPLPGAALLTAMLMKDGGAGGMTSADVLGRIESLGGTLTVDVDADSSRFALAVPRDELGRALALLADIIAHPAFDARELGKLKLRETDQAREEARANGTWMATRVVFRELFSAESPYYRFGLTPAEIARVDERSIRDFHRRWYTASNTEVIVVGDVDAAAGTREIERAFGGLKAGDGPKQGFPPAIPLGKRHVVLVSRPKSAQSDIFVATTVAARTSPEWPALRVSNQVLGGVPSGRLFLDVREERSLAYSARSSIFELAHGPEPLLVYVGTQTPKTGPALQAALENLDGMLARAPTATETEGSRRYLTDVFATRMETMGSIADLIAQQRVLGLADGYWDSYRAALRSVEPAAAGSAAASFAHADRALVVVAGDADALAPVLVHFGDVSIVDPTHDFQTVKTLAFDASAPLEAAAPKSPN